jgi:TolB-like protein
MKPICAVFLVAGVAAAQSATDTKKLETATTSAMRTGIFQKLAYDLEYFSGVLALKAKGQRDSRLSNDEWDKEVRRAQACVPLLKQLHAEKGAYGSGKPLSVPTRSEQHKVYANLITLLNMLLAFDAFDFKAVLKAGERVVVTAKTDLGVVRGEDARYYLDLYREYFFLMAAAHYRLGNDREAVAWLTRIDADTDVQALKKQLASIDTRSKSSRLTALYGKSVALFPPVEKAPGKDTAWLGAGFAEVFSADLFSRTNLLLVERANVDKVFKELALSQAGITDEKAAQRAATSLAASSLIRGVYEVKGEQVTLTLELVEGESGQSLLTASGQLTKADPFAGGRKVLLDLLREAGWLSDDAAAELARARAPSADTIRSLLEARLLLASKSADAKGLYQKAMRDSPEYARAFEDVKKQFEGVNPVTAVMPFTNVTGREDDHWMALGASQALSTDLPVIGFTLSERTKLAQLLKDEALGQVLDERASQSMGKKLSADFVVVGSVMHQAPTARVDVRFLDVATGSVVQTFFVQGKQAEFPKLLAALSAEVARRFNSKLSAEELQKLTGSKLSLAELERVGREEVLKERAARHQAREESKQAEQAKQKEEDSSGKLLVTVASGGAVVAGAALAVASVVMANRAAADVAYIEGLQNFATRDEDAARLESARQAAASVQTGWTVGAGVGTALALGGAAVLVYRVVTAPPEQKPKVDVVESTALVPLVTPQASGVALVGHF